MQIRSLGGNLHVIPKFFFFCGKKQNKKNIINLSYSAFLHGVLKEPI